MADHEPDAERWAEARRRYAKFVARYRTDKRFRESVDKDPTAALAKAGIPVEKGTRVRLVTVDPEDRVLLIPTHDIDLTEAQVTQHCFATAGSFACVGCAGGTFGCGGCFATAGSFNPCFGPSEPKEPDDDEPDDDEREPDDSEPDQPEPETPERP